MACLILTKPKNKLQVTRKNSRFLLLISSIRAGEINYSKLSQ